MARFISILVFGFVVMISVNTGISQTFNGVGPLPVPPGAPVLTVGITTSPCTVTGIGVLGNGCTTLDHLTLNFTHTFVGDVALFLIAPSGQVLELSSSNGGSGDNYQVTTFTDNTGPFITSGSPPYNGTFRPEGRQTNTVPPFPNTNPLGTFTFASTFNGVNADGDWTLFINDYVAIDVGVLNSWSLTFIAGGGTPPTVDLGPDLTICPGQSTTITANVVPSATSYMWSTGASTPSITVSPVVNTTYFITVTNNGCIDKDTINVVINPNGVTANAGPDKNLCQGGSVSLTGSGGGASATYNWSSGQSGQTISVNPTNTTTYTLTVSDGSCSGTDQVTVTVVPIPNADAGPPVSICEGTSILLTATGGTMTNQYVWSNGQNGPNNNVTPFITTTYTVTVTVNGCSATDNVTVTVNPAPSVNAGADVQICSGESTDLDATGTGGTYMWSNGQNGQTITVSPLNTTTYIVTITDLGCTATDNVVVNVVNVNAAITGDDDICEGTSVSLQASGGTSYDWSTGASGSNIMVTPGVTTTYSVTVTQGNCSDVASVQIVVNPVPVAGVSPDESICQGGTAMLTASGGNSYHWSNGANTSTINVSPNTTTSYTVTVTIGDCDDIATVDVIVNPTPNASAGADEDICEGETITLFASGLSGSGTYEWSTGETGASIDVDPTVTTSYTVTVTNQWDCFDTDVVTVNVHPVPVANAGPDQDLCDGSIATLTATGGSTPSSYHWSNGQNGSSITVSPGATTTYSVTITEFGCTDVDDVEVDVIPSPVANAGPDETACAGSEVNLAATGGGSYQWSNGQTASDIDVFPSVTTTYTITVTANNGCTDVDNITVTAIPLPQADAGPDQTICEGEQAILTGSGGTSYEWSNGENTQGITITPVGTTTYNVTVTDINGCSDTDAATIIVNPLPVANAGSNVFLITGEMTTLNATGGGTYLWSTGETTQQITVTPAVTTIYSVTVTLNGCTSIDDVTVFVNEAPAVDLGPDQVICQGESVTINAFVPGPFNLTFIWTNGETTSSILVAPSSTTSYAVTATDLNSGLSSIDTITVTVNTLPLGNPVIMGTNVLCEGTTITYTIDPVSGATAYFWSVPIGATNLSGQGSTSIDVQWGSISGGQVQLIASNSCGSLPASISDIIVNSKPLLVGPINGALNPCALGSGTYSISPLATADTYSWTLSGGGTLFSGQGTSTVEIDWNGAAGGQLCLSATNECGISDTVCLDIVTTSNPVVDAGVDQVLCGLSGNLNATGTGAWTLITGPGTAQFSNANSASSSVLVSAPGMYTLNYSNTQSGCSAADDVLMEFNDEPSIINQVNDCNSTNTAYSVSFEISGGQSPYVINGNAFAGGIYNSAPILSGDPFSYQVTDANGCLSNTIDGQITCSCTSSAGDMDLTQLDACIDASVTAIYLGGGFPDGNDKLAYVLHDGNIQTGIIAWNTIPVFSFISPMVGETTYFISAVIGDEGAGGLPSLTDPCLAVSPGTPVVFHDFPTAFSGTDKVLGCEPDFVQLSATGSSTGSDVTYHWSSPDGGIINGSADVDIINVASAGTFVLSVSNLTSGCASYDTVAVSSTQLSVDNIQIDATQPLCVGDCNGTIQILNGDAAWLFDFGDGNFTSNTSFQSACPGIMNVGIMDSFGCIVDTAVLIDAPTPVTVNLGPDVVIALGDSLILNAESDVNILSFNWFAGDSCTACQSISVSPVETTTYEVEVTDQNGCIATDEIIISVQFPRNIFIPNIFSPNGDQVNDNLIIYGSRDIVSIEFFEIFDRWGNKVFGTENFLPGDISRSWDGTFHGKLLNSGVYVYKIKVLFTNDLELVDTGDFTLIR
ncbi:MAG TPA: gliding motility-associated C-terminal domain-containing protein [Saprospiraceae bacterium]|nr:gliding motility-associated C-terminal domain-containing protein [Saprospiraceae bacterium]